MTEPDWEAIQLAYGRAVAGESLSRSDRRRLQRHDDRIRGLLAPAAQRQCMPSEWLQASVHMLNAAERLIRVSPDWLKQTEEALLDELGRPREVGDSFNVFELRQPVMAVTICTMLAGLALECALKGVIATTGDIPPRTHGLRRLIDQADLQEVVSSACEGVDSEFLIYRAEQAIVWTARYPRPIAGEARHSTGARDHEITRDVALAVIQELAERIGASVS